jgi:O-antigen ligase
LVFAPIIFSQTYKRFVQGTTGWDESLVKRTDKLKIGWHMFKENPLLGVGLGSYPGIWWHYMPEGKIKFAFLQRTEPYYPDMGYIQLLSETGLIGFTLQIGILMILGLKLWQLRKRAYLKGNTFAGGFYSLLLSLLMLLFILNCFQDFWIHPRVCFFYALCLIGFSKVHQHIFSTERSTQQR